MSNTASEKQIGVLPYSLAPADGALVMSVLLWRDPAASSNSLQSGRYFSDMVCARNADLDNSITDAAARVFSEKTRGLFAPKTPNSNSSNVDLSKRILSQKLRKQEGIVQLNNNLYRIMIVPVRYASEAEMSAAIGPTVGEAHWVAVPDLLRTLNSTLDAAELTVSCSNSSALQLPLYLPFISMFRQPTIVTQLTELADSLRAQVGDKVIRVIDDAADATHCSSTGQSDMHNDVFAWSTTEADVPAEPSKPQTEYLCKFCRAVLFVESDLMPHDEGEGQTGFEYRKRSTATKAICTSYFTKSLNWISNTDDYSENEGKILCPQIKCGSRVGSYNWSGDQCSCGAWVVPCLQFLKKSVDVRQPVTSTLVRPLATRAPFVPTRVRPAAAAPATSQSKEPNL